jgi:hypothetical protein
MSAPRKFCPECGQPLPIVGRDTVRLDRHDSDKLRAASTRSPIPPPPPLEPADETSLVMALAEETMPDAGWLRKHLRSRNERAARAVVWVIAIAMTALLVGWVAWKVAY